MRGDTSGRGINVQGLGGGREREEGKHGRREERAEQIVWGTGCPGDHYEGGSRRRRGWLPGRLKGYIPTRQTGMGAGSGGAQGRV